MDAIPASSDGSKKKLLRNIFARPVNLDNTQESARIVFWGWLG
jgi:hypothetical protein